jgi:perosamine synthetase
MERVLASGMLIRGDVVSSFCRKVANLTRCEQVHLTPSGRYAIYSALSGFGLERGKGVVVQTYVCDAVVWAIRRAGLKPVFCDVAEGWVATPEQVGKKIDGSIGAIVLAPPFGIVQSVREFRKFGLPIIQDFCQAAPAVVADLEPEDRADAVCLSFDASKYICAGTGGALLPGAGTAFAGNEDVMGSERFAPFDELRAAVGLAQLEKSERIALRRKSIAERYFAEVPSVMTRDLLPQFNRVHGNLFRFAVRTTQAFDTVATAFASHGIVVRKGVDALAHRASALSDDDFPNSIAAFEQTVSLPFYPALSDRDVELVAATARAVLSVQ